MNPLPGNTSSTQAEKPLDLQAALAAVQDAEQSARRNLAGNTALVYLLWGLTWTIGYGSLWGTQQGWLPWEPTSALTVLAVALAAATVTTVVIFTRSSRGIRGQSAFQGRMYGAAWALGFTVVGALSALIGRAVDDFWLRGLLINSIAVLVVGLLYIAGGAAFNDRAQSYLGIWLLVVTTAALISGPEYFLAVFLFLGATGMLAGAVVEHLRTRRRRSGPSHA
ncbi:MULTISPECIES: hypothetical protein [Arthrobacter]|uniref:Uncharacterized protein n=1 Tax=Arthrobacter caoxuetaonis TaxID=2886935 RepID=A0A9X1MBN3_9MICC|nr:MULTISPECIES: hypothetical protein [Arthrobacter]MCC3281451.1 hypothetical protein [Arthrobacter caoxuetaonis]MCC3296295.1 hypothetical protein [Arthrobacter caoxuetaonis]MCC9192371.1 hypothetical protein [Arthrobacter sp. zg-Y916]USQ56858.1 hypothetical protein NF551_14115 [Arthrobacter caoxuetaonis]